MKIICFDMEGTLTPEIWQEVAYKTNVLDLLKTTRDIPSFDELMDYRISLMHLHNISFSTVKEIASRMQPLVGAKTFIESIRQDFQVVILSDTFYELALPLMEKLGNPLLLCHRLQIENDTIIGYKLRTAKAKQQAVTAFTSMGYSCIAVGDSYNDLQMFEVAEHSFFFNAPKSITEEYSSIPSFSSYDELLTELKRLR
ncbi:MAG: bifunctional phosphoserine phosphatase/homoserine phosphotransferase ThrH [Gammaproteobacteria bacterium]